MPIHLGSVCCGNTRLRRYFILVLFAVLSFGQFDAVAQDQPAPQLPKKWETFNGDKFMAVMRRFLKENPTAEQGRPLVAHAWSQFVATDEVSTAVSPTAMMDLVSMIQSHLDWLKNPDGTYLHGTKETYEARFAQIDAALKKQAQDDPNSTTVYKFSQFRRLWKELAPAADAPLADQIQIGQKRVDAVKAWMAAKDWKALSLTEKLDLATLSIVDQIDKNAFSVRWTGTVQAPQDGEYQFGQLRHPFYDGPCRIYLNDRLVYDSASKDRPSANWTWWGTGVELQAAVPVSLRVEYQYDRDQAVNTPGHYTGFGFQGSLQCFPMMVLMWRGNDGVAEVVPTNMLTPPAEYSGEELQGLWLECISGTDLNAVPKASFVVPNVGQIWTQQPVAPLDPELVSSIQANILESLDAPPVEGVAAPTLPLSQFNAYQFAGSLDARGRQRSLQAIRSRPEALSDVSASRFKFVFDELAMLPGDAKFDLLTGWADQHPSRPITIVTGNPISNWYFHQCHYDYKRLARWFVEGDNQDLERLQEVAFEAQPDGQPRLELICVATYGRFLRHQGHEIQKLVNDKLDQPITGDELAHWLLVKAWVDEILGGEIGQAAIGVPILERAFAVAQNGDLKLKILSQLVVRELMMGSGDKALHRLDEVASLLTTVEQQRMIEQHRSNIAEYQPRIAAWLESLPAQQRDQADNLQATRLQERIDRATARGDRQSAAKYSRQLQALAK